ncbi:MAG: hypothetical protein AB1486_16880 [Planctomycetota bacterium]
MSESSSPSDVLAAVVGRVLEVGASEMEVQYEDGCEQVFALRGRVGVGIASLESGSEEAKALRAALHAIGRKKRDLQVAGRRYELRVRIHDDFGEDAFHVTIKAS